MYKCNSVQIIHWKDAPGHIICYVINRFIEDLRFFNIEPSHLVDSVNTDQALITTVVSYSPMWLSKKKKKEN